MLVSLYFISIYSINPRQFLSSYRRSLCVQARQLQDGSSDPESRCLHVGQREEKMKNAKSA